MFFLNAQTGPNSLLEKSVGRFSIKLGFGFLVLNHMLIYFFLLLYVLLFILIDIVIYLFISLIIIYKKETRTLFTDLCIFFNLLTSSH